jgi:predicted aspartyl protease
MVENSGHTMSSPSPIETPSPTEYREFASQCLRWADRVPELDIRIIMIEIASKWMHMALVVEYVQSQFVRDGITAIRRGDYDAAMRLLLALAERNNNLAQFYVGGKGVSLKADSGIFVVPVEINSTITLDFAVDSGASYVSLPEDVISTLRRAGAVKEADFVGQKTLVLADGSKSRSPTFTIRSLRVGDIVVNDVKCSVRPLKVPPCSANHFLDAFSRGRLTIRHTSCFSNLSRPNPARATRWRVWRLHLYCRQQLP